MFSSSPTQILGAWLRPYKDQQSFDMDLSPYLLELPCIQCMYFNVMRKDQSSNKKNNKREIATSSNALRLSTHSPDRHTPFGNWLITWIIEVPFHIIFAAGGLLIKRRGSPSWSGRSARVGWSATPNLARSRWLSQVPKTMSSSLKTGDSLTRWEPAAGLRLPKYWLVLSAAVGGLQPEGAHWGTNTTLLDQGKCRPHLGRASGFNTEKWGSWNWPEARKALYQSFVLPCWQTGQPADDDFWI